MKRVNLPTSTLTGNSRMKWIMRVTGSWSKIGILLVLTVLTMALPGPLDQIAVTIDPRSLSCCLGAITFMWMAKTCIRGTEIITDKITELAAFYVEIEGKQYFLADETRLYEGWQEFFLANYDPEQHPSKEYAKLHRELTKQKRKLAENEAFNEAQIDTDESIPLALFFFQYNWHFFTYIFIAIKKLLNYFKKFL